MGDKKRILVVDDDLTTVQVLSGILHSAGYEVVVAQDGTTAMMVMQREHPDLVVLDIGLPAGDGFKVMQHMKSNSRFLAVPIIVLSGKDPGQCVDRAFEGGASAYFEKPADGRELCETVAQLLNA